MILSRENLKTISGKNVNVPAAKLLELPEKAIQFGTGVLLQHGHHLRSGHAAAGEGLGGVFL